MVGLLIIFGLFFAMGYNAYYHEWQYLGLWIMSTVNYLAVGFLYNEKNKDAN
jgi:hypothetical protein